MLKEFVCPSGAVLKIGLSPFADSKTLYQALLKELKDVHLDSKMEMSTLFKELFCIGFSSPEIEKALKVCLKRCTYDSGKGEFKIDDSTFEPLEAREDYMSVCMEVAKENVLPFMKSLMQLYSQGLAIVPNTPA